MWVRIPTPKPSAALVSNLIGLAGAGGLVAAVGGLTGNLWWSVLLASLILVGVAYVTLLAAERAAGNGAGPSPRVAVTSAGGLDPAEVQRVQRIVNQALRDAIKTAPRAA